MSYFYHVYFLKQPQRFNWKLSRAYLYTINTRLIISMAFHLTGLCDGIILFNLITIHEYNHWVAGDLTTRLKAFHCRLHMCARLFTVINCDLSARQLFVLLVASAGIYIHGRLSPDDKFARIAIRRTMAIERISNKVFTPRVKKNFPRALANTNTGSPLAEIYIHLRSLVKKRRNK